MWSLDSRVYCPLGPMGHSEAETACRMCSVRHNALFRDREGAHMGYMLTTPTRIMLIAQRLNLLSLTAISPNGPQYCDSRVDRVGVVQGCRRDRVRMLGLLKDRVRVRVIER